MPQAASNIAAYNVTKAGVISLSETLAGEVADSGIEVSCAMPGFFRSNLPGALRAPAGERAVARRLLEHSRHDTTETAHAILSGAADGKLYIVWPREYWLFLEAQAPIASVVLSQTHKVAKAQFSG